MDLEKIHNIGDLKAVGYDQFIRIADLRNELAIADNNLRLIQERISQLEYVDKTRHDGRSDGNI